MTNPHAKSEMRDLPNSDSSVSARGVPGRLDDESRADFEKVTGDAEFPQFLMKNLKVGQLEYFCNNSVHYTVRGTHVKLDILWSWEAAAGTGDTYDASFRGSKARVEIRRFRHEGNDRIKKMFKDKQISEDDERRGLEESQKLTDKKITEVDELLKAKEKEILAV